MARSLSLYRRRTNLVDLTLRSRPGIASYQFQSATNFDGSFTNLAIVPATGLASKSIQDLAIDGSSKFRDQTRFLFDPTDYSLDDTKPIFIRLRPIPVNGSVGTAEAMHMVLPYSSMPDRTIVLAGTAPGAGTIAGSTEIQLPAQCKNLQVQVNGTADLYLAFEPGGTEFRVPSLTLWFSTLILIAPVVTQLFVRGDGVDTTFSAIMALHNNR